MPTTPFAEHTARLTRDLINALVCEQQTPQLAARVADIARRIGDAAANPESIRIDDPHCVVGHIEDDITPATSARNPIAPPMRIERNGDVSCCEITLPAQYQGPPERVHGGFAALMLDQVCGHAAHFGFDRRAFTRYLNVEFLAATPIGAPLLARGWVTRVDGRKRYLRGEIVVDSQVTVSADGLWVSPREQPSL